MTLLLRKSVANTCLNTRLALALWLGLIWAWPASAQFYSGSQMDFGKNRIQWGETIWSYYQFDKFDTYFYLNGSELALYTARYADKQLQTMERRLQTTLSDKIQFIVFNNLGDLKQSNIGLASEQQYNVGGITHIVGTKVILYFDGNYVNFEKQIRAGIADVLVNQLMFGGSLGSQIRNATLLRLPGWYMKGLLSYLSEDWNTQYDGIMLQGIASGRFRKLSRMEGNDALVAGHSFWRFIEKTYGVSAIPDVIHLTQSGRSIQSGFQAVTGVKFRQLAKDWFEYYQQSYKDISLRKPQEQLPLKYRTYRTFIRPNYSPDGNYLSYVSSDEGRIRMYLQDLRTGKRRVMYRAGYSTDEKIDDSFPLTAWHPSGQIFAFVLEEKGRIHLYLYNLGDRSLDKRNLYEFQKVTHISYSTDGRQLAMSAVRQGKPDIYVFDLASNSWTQITDDYYTDLYPVFTEQNRRIVFSSNRPEPSLQKERSPENISRPSTFDLFSYDYIRRTPQLIRLTDTPLANETHASLAAAGLIYYLSDESGFNNIFAGRFDSAIAYVDTTVHYRYFMEANRLTNFTSNIAYFTGSPLNGEYIAASRDGRYDKLFRLRPGELEPTTEAMTRSAFMNNLIEQQQREAVSSVAAQKSRKHFRSVFRPAELLPDTLEGPAPVRQGTFGISGSQRLSLLNQGNEEQRTDQFTQPKRRIYLVEYFYDALTTQIDFSYINRSYQPFTGGGSPIFLNPGFNVLTGINLTDLLEDYRISGGVRLNSSLINNEYVFIFNNLKHRLDRTIVLHRNTLENFDNEQSQFTRTHVHQGVYSATWPFSEILSLRGSAFYRNDMKVWLATDANSLKQKNQYDHWAGLRAELTFDNTRQLGMNLYTGRRWKIFGEFYQMVLPDQRNFSVVGFDFRNYQRIHRNFIWAGRLAGSTSFGQDKLIYYMGGVDNWLIPRFDQTTPIDRTQNYRYQTLATNMRGFNQNIRNGNNFILANTELRFPVFSYLLNNPISSDFVRNFQIVAFGDVGMAWSGLNPYDPANSLYTSYVSSGPLNISVEIQKEPLIGGLGFGARTTLLGYFVRGDLAWGIEDRKLGKPLFYLSFSLDF
ncbi:MAG: hypothetical protein LWX09_11840 [Bacteroidia bacterium]|nr:hypothetical protein [Bacteroidia bacterium]